MRSHLPLQLVDENVQSQNTSFVKHSGVIKGGRKHLCLCACLSIIINEIEE